MKCIEEIEGEVYYVFRTSDRHARKLVLSGVYRYMPKSSWKTGGRKRMGPQDHEPNSIHPRKGWGNREKKGRWGR